MDFVTKYTHISSFHVFMNPNHFVVQKERSFSNLSRYKYDTRSSQACTSSQSLYGQIRNQHTVCVCVSYSVNDLFGCFCKAALLRCRHNTVVAMTQNKGGWWGWVCCCCLSWGCSCASQRSYVNMYVKLLEAHPKQNTDRAQTQLIRSRGRSMVHNTVWQLSDVNHTLCITHYKLTSMTCIRTWLHCPFWFMSWRKLWVKFE